MPSIVIISISSLPHPVSCLHSSVTAKHAYMHTCAFNCIIIHITNPQHGCLPTSLEFVLETSGFTRTTQYAIYIKGTYGPYVHRFNHLGV